MKTCFLKTTNCIHILLIFLWVADLNGQDVFSKYEDDPVYIDVGKDKQLFVDDYLIEYKRSVDFVMNPPYLTGEILIEADLPCETGGLVCVYSSVLKENDGRIRIWYGFSKDGEEHVRYAESTDGINFVKPNLGLYNIDGSKDNNVVIPGFIAGSSVWIDPNALPEHRYKTQTKIYPYGEQLPLWEKSKTDLVIHSSPDGIKWNFYSELTPRGAKDTQVIVFWDENLNKYLFYGRHKGKDPRIIISRCVRRAEMDDVRSVDVNTGLVIWTDLTDHNIYPQYRGDFIPVDYYGATVFPYENIYIALAQAHWRQNYLPEQSPGMRDVRLSISRDSKEFTRAGSRKVFMGPGPSGRFDSKSVWAMPNPIVMGDEIWIYYSGRNMDRAGTDPDAPDGERRSAISRAIMRLDGFVSVDAPYVGGGEIITRPLRFQGDKLEINADTGAGGSIRVEILDKNGFPLPGFTMDESVWIIGNSVRFPVRWTSGRSLESLHGETVRLRFVMQDCKLYSFQFK